MILTATIQAILPSSDGIQVTLLRSDIGIENKQFDASLDADSLQTAIQTYIDGLIAVPKFDDLIGAVVTQQ